jgi:hypothetical protein
MGPEGLSAGRQYAFGEIAAPKAVRKMILRSRKMLQFWM